MSKTKTLFEKLLMDWSEDQKVDDSYQYELYLLENNLTKKPN